MDVEIMVSARQARRLGHSMWTTQQTTQRRIDRDRALWMRAARDVQGGISK